jgi:hypothetical protein
MMLNHVFVSISATLNHIEPCTMLDNVLISIRKKIELFNYDATLLILPHAFSKGSLTTYGSIS